MINLLVKIITKIKIIKIAKINNYFLIINYRIKIKNNKLKKLLIIIKLNLIILIL